MTLALNDLTPAQLVAVYNHHNAEPVSRFASAAVGRARLLKVLASAEIQIDDAIAATFPDEAVRGYPATVAPAPKAAAGGRKGKAAPQVAPIAGMAPLGKPAAAPAPDGEGPTYTGGLRVVTLTDQERAAITAAMMQTTANLTESVAVSVLEKIRTAMPTSRVTSAPRKSAAGHGGMTVNQRAMVALLTKDAGATGKELAAACGWPTIAARATCQNLASKLGYTLTELPKGDGRTGITFYFTTTP